MWISRGVSRFTILIASIAVPVAPGGVARAQGVEFTAADEPVVRSFDVLLKAPEMSFDELAVVAGHPMFGGGAASYLVSHEPIQAEAGWIVFDSAGARVLEAGEIVERGLVWTAMDRKPLLNGFDLGFNALMAVDVTPRDADVDCPGGCNVECRADYFSCCYLTKKNEAKCRCLSENHGFRQCDAGGPGSVACAVCPKALTTQSDLHDDDSVTPGDEQRLPRN